MNKKETGFFKQYLWTLEKQGCRDLYDCYKEPSTTKVAIWHDIKFQFQDVNNIETEKKYLTVTGYNCNFFSAGYCVKKEGTWYYRHITRWTAWDIKITDEEYEEVRHVVHSYL